VAPLCLVLAGCYTGSAQTVTATEIARDPGWLLVPDVPFVGQEGEHDCGAAALVMVLRYWDVRVTVQDIAAAFPSSRGRGLTAGELREFAHARGLRAFVIHGEPADLRAELERGRPLIVGLAKAHGAQKLAHYEVVVGLHRGRRRILTLDPAEGWRENTVEGFAEEWAPAQRAALVIFRAADEPARGKPETN
jgi:ABC-type bacteriocin/lantibiotic exporter with double-glycine peptidase domain